MKAWSDEQVSAYLDGALESDLVAAFEADLAQEAALRDRLEAMRQTDVALRDAFAAPLSEPVPDRFRALFEDAAPPPVVVDAVVVDLAARRAQSRSLSHDWRVPLAASIALIVGLAGGMSVNGGRAADHTILRADATAIDAANPLHGLLNDTPSAQRVTLAADDTFTPVLSFTAADGRYCREFELISEEAVAVGVACRDTEAWRLEVLLAADDRPASGDGPASGQGYVQASGFNVAALDAVAASLGAGDALGPQAEAEAIAGEWRPR